MLLKINHPFREIKECAVNCNAPASMGQPGTSSIVIVFNCMEILLTDLLQLQHSMKLNTNSAKYIFVNVEKIILHEREYLIPLTVISKIYYYNGSYCEWIYFIIQLFFLYELIYFYLFYIYKIEKKKLWKVITLFSQTVQWV